MSKWPQRAVPGAIRLAMAKPPNLGDPWFSLTLEGGPGTALVHFLYVGFG